jgi:hypothetical protein
MLSSMDEYPLHQTPEPIRFVGTSDRNFYDRYYFNLHNCNGEIFMIMGMGQYPNLAVQDAFAVVRRGHKHKVVRASRLMGDRADISVGPFRIEVIEGLKKVRFILERNEHGIEFDVRWQGAIPAHHETNQFVRQLGRITMNTSRFAQTGYWTGTLRVGDETFKVTPDSWWGTRDRSWGIRPIAEAEPPGARQAELPFNMWNYMPMQFKDSTILYIVSERSDGERIQEEAVRIWNDPARPVEHLGRPEHEHTIRPGTNVIERSVLSFPHAPGGGFQVRATPLIDCYIGIGTGYGFDNDWRHGMYQGPLVVQGLELDTIDDAGRLFGICDCVGRFELGKEAGYGLFEYMFLGSFPRYGV